MGKSARIYENGVWESLAIRVVWDHETLGSNPRSPTSETHIRMGLTNILGPCKGMGGSPTPKQKKSGSGSPGVDGVGRLLPCQV